jgi:hypothetical protein
MSLLAEEVIEEWLRRDGHFTMRGIKLGNHEIDLLAVKRSGDKIICRHIEVQAAVRAISYISHTNTAKHRSEKELYQEVKKWILKKFCLPSKKILMKPLWDAEWTSELVVGDVKYPREISILEKEGVIVHRLKDVIQSLATEKLMLRRAVGADLVDLVQMTNRPLAPFAPE